MIKNCLISILFSFLTFVILGQKLDLKQFKNLKIRSLGPSGTSGRVTSIDVVLNNPSTIYVGTASGGVWKSLNEGSTWKPIFDDQPVSSIGAVAINQKNPDEIWVGTGEGNPRNSYSSGAGIYKSLDGGDTWMFMGLKNTKSIHRIIIDKENSNNVYVAAMGSGWGPNKERGVFKTTDGGKRWKKILYVNQSTGAADMVVDPKNPNKLLVAMWEHERNPWFFTSGGKGSGLYVTIDGGKTWVKRTDKDGIPEGELGRMGLAISPSSPNIVYALIESKKNGLYKSTDGGKNWKLISTKNIGNRPFYYADIYVDPKNENRLYNLYSVLSRSDDGGKNFQTIGNYQEIHPDHHAFWIHPHNPEFIIEGNDGGLNISHDMGKTWRFIENIPVGQFYHINYDMDIPYHVYGGMQDNGSWIGVAYAWQNGGLRNSNWQEVLFGDGFDVMPYAKDSRYGYAMYQGGNIYRYDKITGRKVYIQPNSNDSVELRFNWNGPLAQDPFNEDGLYFGSQFVHKSPDKGKTWKTISPDLTTNDTSKQKQALSGGLTIDATRAENFTTITVVAPSNLEKEVVWVGTDDGNIQLTRDGGKTWVNVMAKIKNFPKGAWIPQIEVSRHKKGEAFVVVNDYRRNNWKPYVYKTSDYGNKWTRLVDGQKVEGHCHTLVQDLEVPELLFLGTEYGLYISFDAGLNWNKWKKGFSSVPVVDLKIHPREGDLIIGTFGRAAYILDNISFLRKVAKDSRVLNKDFAVFSIPDAYLSQYNRPLGTRFIAHATFQGDNRPFGAMITYWVKDIIEKDSTKNKAAEKTSQGKPKPIKVKVTVLDKDKNTVRVFTIKPDTGLNRAYWNMMRDGPIYPSHKEPKKDEDKPNGRYILPGSYLVKCTYGSWSDSVWVKVHPDPRIKVTLEELSKRDKELQNVEKLASVANDAFTRLKDLKKVMKMVNNQVNFMKVKKAESFKKVEKQVNQSIDSLFNLFLTPKDFNGYDHVTTRIVNLIYRANQFVGTSEEGLSDNVMLAVKKATDELESALKGINDLVSGEWSTYKKEADKLNINLFKEQKPLGIDK